jgi:hypothetical protein
MSAEPVDLVGPGGWEHGFIAVRPPATLRAGAHIGKARAGGSGRTRRLVRSDVRRAESGLRGRMTASEIADRASSKISGHKASDYQHLAAARLHAAAGRQAGSANIKSHHARMAAMHRGIAQRTPGRGTRGATRPSGQKGRITAPSRGRSAPKGPAGLRPGETRAPSTGKTQGPNVGELGKASYGSHRLPKGANALTKEGRAKAYAHGHALPPPSPGSPHGFPVTSPKSWEDARKAVGRAGSPQRKAMLRDLLRRTAAQYGKTAALKKSWAASNTGPAVELAMQRYPKLAVTSPYDVMITRDADGAAVIRHRRGGYEIARIRREPTGEWVAAIEGRDLPPHTRQRGALMEAIGLHNRQAGNAQNRPEPKATIARPEPLQPAPVQTELMAQYGIPAIRALATPTRGSSDGPRVTGTGPAADVAGLRPRGATIYKKLKARGFPHARAHAFARRAQNRVAK